MNDLIVEARGLTKVYRLYKKPLDRLLDVLGLLNPSKVGHYSALSGIDLEIRRGEKIAIIGPNGAGKSTLLKIISGTLRPTAGDLQVRGRVHALLQIGAGFHPEFTGLENARAYLATLGLEGREAERALEDAISFAEIEHYIDQPMRTYSTGMGARLMFAVSTVIAPEILILDEVLGVGDAYFARKSYARIREMCAREGTTTILVSHDVYSAASLADRLIWIEKGRIARQGPGSEVARAYEESVRLQEEERLRQRALRTSEAEGATPWIVELRSADGRPLPSTVYVNELGLADSKRWQTLDRGEGLDGGGRIILDGSAWGTEESRDGRPCRPFLNHGSVFYAVKALFHVSRDEAPRALRLTACVDKPVRVGLLATSRSTMLDFGEVDIAPGGFTEFEIQAPSPTERREARGVGMGGPVSAAPRDEFTVGSGSVVVESVRSEDAMGASTRIWEFGKAARLVMTLEKRDPRWTDSLQAALSFYREDIPLALRSLTPPFSIPAGSDRFEVAISWPELTLGLGVYSVGLQIVKAGYYDQPQVSFYTLHPDVIFALSRFMQVRVNGDASIAAGTVAMIPGLCAVSPLAKGEAP